MTNSGPLLPGATVVGPHRDVIQVSGLDLEAHTAALLGAGYRLALVAGHHDEDTNLRVVYVFTHGPPDRRVELHLRLPAGGTRIPTLAGLSFPASRFERELQDLFGIEPIGHPQPARLVLHQHWPAGWHPMRNDAGAPPPFGDERHAYPFMTVEGPGVYEIPVGPVHAGVIEPGHFRFSVVGETILNMRARLWFVHKGIERLFQGRDLNSAVELAERISGDTAVGHNLAYCLAVEEAAGIEVSHAAQLRRAALLELERLYNHVTDIGALCNDVGYGIANTHALRIREQLLRVNKAVTGHRLLRGGIYPGGATIVELPTAATLITIAADLHEIVDIAMANTTVLDRFTGTAVLATDQATEIGTLGYVARASGLPLDARLAHPFTDCYEPLRVPTSETGDVLARFQIRLDEIDASIALLQALFPLLDAGASKSSRETSSIRGSGLGIVEGWRGTIVHRVELDETGHLQRVKVVDPSFFNWPAVAVALADTIVPDFPLTNKSFNLSYAGNDL